MGSDADFVKMSEKGQLVVPQEIRDSLNLNPGDRFVAVPLSDGIVFKRIVMPKIDFEALAKDVEKQFKDRKIRPSDVNGAVKWARKR
jgi:AbrB family looped-hinge helix DNA binding protein